MATSGSHAPSSPYRSEWSTIDAASVPEEFVTYLDTITALDQAREYKRRTFALLRPVPGCRFLDAGCGAGDDAIALARLVVPGGAVVGIDASATMVATARERAAGLDLPVTFQTGDITGIDAEDGAFDGARADRVFQHLDDPAAALAELARVTRPGGRIVLSDPDWETLVIDAADPELTREILARGHATTRRFRMGRGLRRLMLDGGLTEVTVDPFTGIIFDFPLANAILGLDHAAEAAVETGAASAGDAAAWIAGLKDADRAGRFFSAMTIFIVAGTRPEAPAAP